MNHYVYIVTDPDTREYYIGSRSCSCFPEDDIDYKGSQYYWKLSKDQKQSLKKDIIKKGFSSRSEASSYEAELIREKFLDPLNKNGAIPSPEFHTSGKVVVRDESGKIFCVKITDERYIKRELVPVNTGRVLTEDHKRKISWKGKTHTLETRMKMSFSKKGKKKTGKTRSLEIQQYDLEGNYIKTWKSLSEAAKQLGISVGNISSVLNGRLFQTKGFIFKR